MSQNFDPSILSDPEIASDIRAVLKDVSNLMTIGAANRTAIAEAYKGLSENTGVPNRVLRKLGRTYHRNSFKDEQEDHEVVSEAYTQVFGEPVE